MTAELLKLAGSIAAILFIAWLARFLRLGGDVRIRSEEQAREIANETCCGFDPVEIAIDKAGIAALLRDAEGDVPAVLLGDGRQVDAHAGQIDVSLALEQAAVDDAAAHGGVLFAQHLQIDQTVVHGDLVPHRHRLDETLVVDVDGTLLDVVRAGFLHGTMLVPQAVLLELQGLADAAERSRKSQSSSSSGSRAL